MLLSGRLEKVIFLVYTEGCTVHVLKFDKTKCFGA
jgi:hypothetical protein